MDARVPGNNNRYVERMFPKLGRVQMKKYKFMKLQLCKETREFIEHLTP